MVSRTLRLCSFVWMNLRENLKMNLCRFEWMDMCVFLVDLEDKMSGFGDKFCES